MSLCVITYLNNVSFAPAAGEQKNLGKAYYQKGFSSRCQLKQIMPPFFYVIKLNGLLIIQDGDGIKFDKSSSGHPERKTYRII
jgi:hypothetical protein